jgi:bifunctional non-homologous end joining protein LigD
VKVEIKRPDKVLFPDDGITKADLASYYERVAPAMLPHLKGRPLNLWLYPDGIAKRGILRQSIPNHFPDWIPRVEVPKRGGSVVHAMAGSADALVYLAGQACITPHVWLSRADRLDRPDRMVFDLDPSREDFAAVRRAARQVGELLEELGLACYAMTTGSRGVHVVVPLRRTHGVDEVRAFSRDVAGLLAARHREDLTVEARKAKRGDRILIDVARNGYAQTVVAPYAVRPKPGAPVATPIRWEELSDRRLTPQRYDLRSLFRRLDRVGDAWEGIGSDARSLRQARRRLDDLSS